MRRRMVGGGGGRHRLMAALPSRAGVLAGFLLYLFQNPLNQTCDSDSRSSQKSSETPPLGGGGTWPATRATP